MNICTIIFLWLFIISTILHFLPSISLSLFFLFVFGGKVSALNAKGTSEGITYNLVSPTNSPFAINDMSGEIFVAFEGIDYETEMSYVLNVSATDGRWPEARYVTMVFLNQCHGDRRSWTRTSEFVTILRPLPKEASLKDSIPSSPPYQQHPLSIELENASLYSRHPLLIVLKNASPLPTASTLDCTWKCIPPTHVTGHSWLYLKMPAIIA